MKGSLESQVYWNGSAAIDVHNHEWTDRQLKRVRASLGDPFYTPIQKELHESQIYKALIADKRC
jgi:hypothetical protein